MKNNKSTTPVLKKHSNLIRKSSYSLDEVLPFVTQDLIKKDYEGDFIKMNSLRYQTFVSSGITCVVCGLIASFFAKEKNPTTKSYHFNLYGIDAEGDEVLFTKDHIFPKSKGGPDTLSNLQTMCSVCNGIKADSLPS